MKTAVREKPILFSGPMVLAILEGRKTQTRRVIKPQPAWKKGEGLSADGWSWQNRDVKFSSYVDEACFAEDLAKYAPHEPGDELWVRETWADVNSEDGPAIAYRANGAYQTWHDFSDTFGPDFGAGPSMDYDAYPGDYVMWLTDLLNGEPDHKWRPSIHMPRWASRLQLLINDVRVERLQDIREADAIAEGAMQVELPPCDDAFHPPGSYGYAYHDDGENTIYPTCVRAFENLWDSINGKPRADGVDISWKANPWCWAITFEPVG